MVGIFLLGQSIDPTPWDVPVSKSEVVADDPTAFDDLAQRYNRFVNASKSLKKITVDCGKDLSDVGRFFNCLAGPPSKNEKRTGEVEKAGEVLLAEKIIIPLAPVIAVPVLVYGAIKLWDFASLEYYKSHGWSAYLNATAVQASSLMEWNERLDAAIAWQDKIVERLKGRDSLNKSQRETLVRAYFTMADLWDKRKRTTLLMQRAQQIMQLDIAMLPELNKRFELGLPDDKLSFEKVFGRMASLDENRGSELAGRWNLANLTVEHHLNRAVDLIVNREMREAVTALELAREADKKLDPDKSRSREIDTADAALHLYYALSHPTDYDFAGLYYKEAAILLAKAGEDAEANEAMVRSNEAFKQHILSKLANQKLAEVGEYAKSVVTDVTSNPAAYGGEETEAYARAEIGARMLQIEVERRLGRDWRMEETTGVDTLNVMRSALRERVKEKGWEGYYNDVKLDLPPSHELAMLAREELNTGEKVERFLSSVNRVLNPGGRESLHKIAIQFEGAKGSIYDRWMTFDKAEPVIATHNRPYFGRYLKLLNSVRREVETGFARNDPDTSYTQEDITNLTMKVIRGEDLREKGEIDPGVVMQRHLARRSAEIAREQLAARAETTAKLAEMAKPVEPARPEESVRAEGVKESDTDKDRREDVKGKPHGK